MTLPRVSALRPIVGLTLLVAFSLLQACASKPYTGSVVSSSDFLQRSVSQQQGSVQVTTAVPTAQETLALTGLDLHQQGIQPVWIEVENQGDTRVRAAPWSMDANYFSPLEVSYMNRKPYSSKGEAAMERWFYNNSLDRSIPPGEKRSGLVYTHLTPGTKGFNLDVFGDQKSYNFTFFVPMPGFVADYMRVDFDTLYADDDFRKMHVDELKVLLETELGCCASNESADAEGAPFNVVLVGSPLAVKRAMLRGGWRESAADDPATADARQQYQFGRSPDATFSIVRGDGEEAIELRLWVAPWQVQSEPVWLAQAIFREQAPSLIERFARESLAADLDNAMRFVYQNIWYNQSMSKAGFVGGVGASTQDQPRSSYTGAEYFTDGQRVVMFVEENPQAMGEAQVLWQADASEEKALAGHTELFQGKQVPAPNDRQYRQAEGEIVVTTAVPSAKEVRKIFGANLYRKNIQPVWIQVENLSDSMRFLTPLGLDRGYYTPREAAHRSRGNKLGKPLDKSYESSAIARLRIPAQSVRSGYIFTRVDEGTKSFNVDILGGAAPRMMTFHVPVPGLKLDHHAVDVKGMYSPEQLKYVDLQQLVQELDALPCCVTNKAGEGSGDPLNLVFVADIDDLYYTFMRAGWDETETIYGASLFKTAASALLGGAYRYSPVSALYVFGRSQDAAMQRARTSINERNHLRVWLTPLRHEGKPVWIGQISRDIGVHLTWKTITTHKIDPNVDETREFLLEDLAYAQSLSKIGYVGGVGAASYDEPRGNLTGDPYLTDGRRVIMWVSSELTSISEIEILGLISPGSVVDTSSGER